MKKDKTIYFDYSSTTPVDEKVVKKMLPYFSDKYGNPSSVYFLGQKSLFAIDESRKTIAIFLNCKPQEIFFTGSATEANNLAILGLINNKENIHIITSQIEHDSVLNVCKHLEKNNVSVTYLKVNNQGLINVDDFKKSLRKETVLVSIMYANNEIGTIQPIKEIQEIIEKENINRKNKIIFHSDAVQAINYLDCQVNNLKVDMLTFSGHKIYGPKGIGVLYCKRGININPIIHGGGQEQGLRPGTENVASIVGLGEAIKLVVENKKQEKKTLKLRNKIIKEVLSKIDNSELNGSYEKRIPNNINFSFKGAEGESIVMALDQKDICVSTGSACSSRNLQPSHVLLAMGLSREQAHCSLRITLGRYTKQKEVDYLIKNLLVIIKKLRKISGKK